ncbi:MAG: hypothetical protein KDC80_02340 [Saprospiraceae bacterium]|nr:hypothetical protein [Saprospiraceae bacterium]
MKYLIFGILISLIPPTDPGSHSPSGKMAVCFTFNPLNELHWLRTLKQQDPNKAIVQYERSGKTYFKLYNCRSKTSYAYWYDCAGNYKGKCPQDDRANYILRGARKVRVWYYPCLQIYTPTLCVTTCNIVSPAKNKSFTKGSNVLVKVEPDKRTDIKFIDLYLNNKLVRSDRSYPFEWGRMLSDQLLYNLNPGSYKLKAIAQDHCGGSMSFESVFSVQ